VDEGPRISLSDRVEFLIGTPLFDWPQPLANPGDQPSGAGIDRNVLELTLLLLRAGKQ
jgi:hypothetical protein